MQIWGGLDLLPALGLAAERELNLDAESMTAWARLVVNVAYLLLGAVLGAGAASGYQQRKARFLQSALSPGERTAVAAHLSGRGQGEEASLLVSAPEQTLEAVDATLLSMLAPEERSAVAQRLARQTEAGAAGAPATWTTEPPARSIISSREASARLREQAQQRMLKSAAREDAGLPAADLEGDGTGLGGQRMEYISLRREGEPGWVLTPRPTTLEDGSGQAVLPGQASARDPRMLAALWRVAAEVCEAWVKSPAEGWLAQMDQPDGPGQAIGAMEEALLDAGYPVGDSARLASAPRLIRELHVAVHTARTVLEHTRRALADGRDRRARSLQIASTAEYALREMRESAALLERLAIEDKLASL